LYRHVETISIGRKGRRVRGRGGGWEGEKEREKEREKEDELVRRGGWLATPMRRKSTTYNQRCTNCTTSHHQFHPITSLTTNFTPQRFTYTPEPVADCSRVSIRYRESKVLVTAAAAQTPTKQQQQCYSFGTQACQSSAIYQNKVAKATHTQAFM
jgi:hypothetical protein